MDSRVGCGSGAGGWRPAPQLFPSACPYGYRVTISIRKCHLTLLYGERVSLLAVSGGMKKRSLQEKAALGRRKFCFCFCFYFLFFWYRTFQNGFLISVEGGKSLCRSRRVEQREGGTATCAHACTCMCMRTHNLGYLCAI